MSEGTIFAPVKSVDWSDTTIERAGIIPIVVNEDERWIGLCISKYNTSIGTFGGSYESSDYDLLDTAVREFNEEVGDNFQHITCEDLYDCYALKSSQSISVFVPFNEKPKTFRSTEEIYDLLWVTPSQMECFLENKDMVLDYVERYKRHKAFLLSCDLGKIGNAIVDIVSEHSNYYLLTEVPILRSKRSTIIIDYNQTTDFNTFIHDMKVKPYWNKLFLISTETNIIISRRDKTIYVFPITDKILILNALTMLNGNKIKLLVGDNSDFINYSDVILPYNVFIVSMKQHAKSGRVPYIIPKNYDRLLLSARNSDSFMTELEFLFQYEEKIYFEINKLGKYFNPQRAIFLDRIKFIINCEYNSRKDLYSKFQRKFGRSGPSPSIIINIALRIGLIRF